MKIRQYEHRLEKLKRHNCSGNYIYDSNNEDEDYLTDYNLSSRRSVRRQPQTRKASTRLKEMEESKEREQKWYILYPILIYFDFIFSG